MNSDHKPKIMSVWSSLLDLLVIIWNAYTVKLLRNAPNVYRTRASEPRSLLEAGVSSKLGVYWNTGL